jgi:NitT/TauT family transport system ATP-binding protein
VTPPTAGGTLGVSDLLALLDAAAMLGRQTLVTRIHAALRANHDHRLPEALFLDVLEKHFSPAEARRQLDTAIQWGRYAELFGFEADTGEIFLEAPAAGAAELW